VGFAVLLIYKCNQNEHSLDINVLASDLKSDMI